jgi:hypothetical protein
MPAVLKPQASAATTSGFNNLSLRFEIDGMKYLLYVLLLSTTLVSNDAEATTCSMMKYIKIKISLIIKGPRYLSI